MNLSIVRSVGVLRQVLAVIGIALGSVSAIAAEVDYAALYAELSPGVVTIHTLAMGPQSLGKQPSSGVGSGFFIDADHVMTAAHVVAVADRIRVRGRDGRTLRATVVSSIDSSDVALLRVDAPPAESHALRLGNSGTLSIGDPVFVIGAPFGLDHTLTIGHLSGTTTRSLIVGGAPVRLLQTDAAINPGNSGGPLFNAQGDVVGVVSFIMSKSGGFDGVGFATSIETAYAALMDSSGFWAGFEGIVLSEQQASLLNVPSAGILVQRVVEASSADRSGLRASTVQASIDGQALRLGGDVILEINGFVCVEPHDFRALSEAARLLRADQGYELTVFRDGKVIRLHAEPGEVNDAARPVLPPVPSVQDGRRVANVPDLTVE